jgi:hypothetical protein
MNRFSSPASDSSTGPAFGPAPQIDVHQHIWPEPLIDALRARTQPPRLRGWTLELSGQPDYTVDPQQHDASARAAEAFDDGLELALVSLSSPLGIEFLPAGEAHELLDAYHEGALTLPHPFGAWASAGVTEIDPAALEQVLASGFVGLQLPATALLDDQGYARVGPLLEVLEAGGRPLFIHPGPAADPEWREHPPWWAAIVTYVQQMHAAWFAFREHGRPRHPRLRVCFAMLAGLAPLHGERFAARAGARTVVDEDLFVEVSSYGTRAVDATIRALGVDVLVNGSDRPYARPVTPDHLGLAALSALRSTNPLRLLNLKEVSHGRAIPAGAQS